MASINIVARTWVRGVYSDVILAVPVRHRGLIAAHCAQAGTAPATYWLTGTEPQVWLQLPGVVVAEVL